VVGGEREREEKEVVSEGSDGREELLCKFYEVLLR